MKLELGFLASHGGSNFKAILDNINQGKLKVVPKVLISNNPFSAALKIADECSIQNFCINSRTSSENGFLNPDDYILEILKKYEVNLVILAGYMKPLGDQVIEYYPSRVLNIHPALLPKYGGKGMYGMNVHEAVIKSEDIETGATVHLVTSLYDSGRILGQCKVPRYKKDNAKTLSERVLVFEHILYSQVLKDIESGIIEL